MLRFTVSNANGVKARVQKKESLLYEVLSVKLNALLGQIYARVQQKLSGEVLRKRTGALAASVVIEPATDTGGKITGAVLIPESSPTALYAKANELGSRPHQILASKSRALHFIFDGRERWFRSVQHPGTPARSFMRSTEEEFRDPFREEPQAEVNRILHEK